MTLTRREAGRRLRRRAEQMSASTETLEDSMVARSLQVLASRGAVVWGQVEAELDQSGSALVVAKSGSLFELVEIQSARVIEDVAGDLREALAEVKREAIESIVDELGWCEETSRELRGLSDVAGLVVRTTGETLVTDMVDTFVAEAHRPGVVMGEFARQLRLWQSRDETDDDLFARLFASRPAGLHGARGLGAWTSQVSWLATLVRASSVATQNAVREQAMRAFNDAA